MSCASSSTNISAEGLYSLIDMINMSTPGSGSDVSVTPGSTPSRASQRVYSCVLTQTSSASDSAVHVTSIPESTASVIPTSTLKFTTSDGAVDVISTPLSDISESTPKQSHESISDSISKYLVQYVSPPPAKKTGIARVTGFRVLTSDEGYAILREKEEKSKK